MAGFIDALRPTLFYWRAVQEMASEDHVVAYCHERVLAI
jgi:hypothetical protein